MITMSLSGLHTHTHARARAHAHTNLCQVWILHQRIGGILPFFFSQTLSSVGLSLCVVYVIWSKTHKRLKERFLIRRNRTKRANFRCNYLFRSTYNTTENSQTNLSLSVRCQEAGGRKRARDCLDEKRTLCPLGARKLAEGKGHEIAQTRKGERTKISCFNCFLLYCTQLEKDNYIENLHVLSCFV